MSWTPFGLDTIKQIVSGNGVTPVQNLIGGITHPGISVSTTSTQGLSSSDYSPVSTGGSTTNNVQYGPSIPAHKQQQTRPLLQINLSLQQIMEVRIRFKHKIKQSLGGVTYKSDGKGGWIAQAQQNAEDARSQTLAAIQNRLNAARETASGVRNRAKESFDYLTKSISERYPALIDSTEQKKTSALTTIGQQATDTANAYERANMQTRRASENAALQTRMNARAGNRLGSSFYNDAIGQNKEALSTQLGASNLEAISKRSAYDTQKNDTTQYYNDAIREIQNTAKDAEQQAYQEYQGAVAQADQLEKAGLLDFGEGVAQAEQNLQSRLSQIDAYANALATTISLSRHINLLQGWERLQSILQLPQQLEITQH
jgi:hypothetical protein